MAEKKKPVRAVDLYINKGNEIDKAYSQDNETIRDLAVIYNCSHNTMMITIGMLGYPVENWCKESVEKKLEYVAKQKEKRIKVK